MAAAAETSLRAAKDACLRAEIDGLRTRQRERERAHSGTPSIRTLDEDAVSERIEEMLHPAKPERDAPDAAVTTLGTLASGAEPQNTQAECSAEAAVIQERVRAYLAKLRVVAEAKREENVAAQMLAVLDAAFPTVEQRQRVMHRMMARSLSLGAMVALIKRELDLPLAMKADAALLKARPALSPCRLPPAACRPPPAAAGARVADLGAAVTRRPQSG